MNPITALSEQLQKLIIEHGGAAITRDNLAYLRDQLSALEKQYSSLEKENEKLKFENSDLKTNISLLEEENESQKKRADNLQKYIEQNKTPIRMPKPIKAIGPR